MTLEERKQLINEELSHMKKIKDEYKQLYKEYAEKYKEMRTQEVKDAEEIRFIRKKRDEYQNLWHSYAQKIRQFRGFDKFGPVDGCEKNQGKYYHTIAWQYFINIGEIPTDYKPNEYVLHHKDESLRETDPARYWSWNIEDLVVEKRSEHQKHHRSGKHITDEHKMKLIESRKKSNISDDIS